MDCIFCKIINGDIPCYKIYEDEYVLSFLDISPKANGHTLIIPKNHTLDITTISDDELLNVINASKKVVKILEDKLNINGYTLVQNNGKPQEVKHFHLHIIPSYESNDELKDVEQIYNKIIK